MDTHHQPQVDPKALSDNLAILIQELEAAGKVLNQLQYARPSDDLMERRNGKEKWGQRRNGDSAAWQGRVF
ncbi:hypothetical protein [Thiohalocapsa sp. ML1]|uniref:hypothetical protein n=1 Tax=Thiohalocapsa sp. ML1 TaxID=1431688 RepID=UPI00073220EA|nr:hypothetical protein [Thiohalocapsa sp. ML1]